MELVCTRTLLAVSLVTFAIVAVLVVSEIAAYVSSTTREHISVDPTVGQRMSIHFDVTFHALRCKGELVCLPKAPSSVYMLPRRSQF